MSAIRLAVFDIDGTLRRERSPWWHLHEHLGLAESARAFAPMFERGEITYEEWADLDAALWRGRSRSEIAGALASNPLRDGAAGLVRWFRDRRIPCVAISTGLSIFAAATADELGLDEVVCNELLFDGDTCRGEVTVRVTEHNKAEVLRDVLVRRAVEARDAVAFGDGPADLPMLEAAGIGVAVCPRDPRVRAAADYVVEAEPIDRIVEVLGAIHAG
ncbi:MAG TPA: HAD family phosphatase [Phycisphaerae bacterium]|nr:HAD family phosphatase [Phycisphaerae bacterium]